jgi:6-phosphofructokinase 1
MEQTKQIGVVLFASTSFLCWVATFARRRRDQRFVHETEKATVVGGSVAQTDKEAPKGKLLSGHSVGEIYLHELETLRGKHRSADLDVCKIFNFQEILGVDDYILADISRLSSKQSAPSNAYVRAGPRRVTHFDPSQVRAAIVTCGGLCPGLNNVIRELVHALVKLYKVTEITGITGGYVGFSGKPGYEPVKLDIEAVKDCHHQGGTILGSGRGGLEPGDPKSVQAALDFLTRRGINQLYIIGGDGTHRGANQLAAACKERGLNIAVVGIPKTIDNDVGLIDRSFGFNTSVEAAQLAIKSAKTEAIGNKPNGISIVKLMGRTAGFIAAHATLASGDVDLCLLPEHQAELYGENGCLPFLVSRVKAKGHAVVVMAEGWGERVMDKSNAVDAGGNRILPDVGPFMKKLVADYFKKQGMEATVKFIEPSYMIRSIPPNSWDAIYCMMLAQNAVHGAMSGFTAFSVGLVNNRIVYIPIERIVATSPHLMDAKGRTWERILAMTLQPDQCKA